MRKFKPAPYQLLSICSLVGVLLYASFPVPADASLDAAQAAAAYLNTLCTEFPDRTSNTKGQRAAGNWIYDTLTGQGCTVYRVNSRQAEGNYVNLDVQYDELPTEETDNEAEAPTGNLFLDGVPYVYVPETRPAEEALETASETAGEEASTQTPVYKSPLTADNLIVHIDGHSEETVFLSCYYDTAAACSLDETPAATGTSAVAFLMGAAVQLAQNAEELHYNVDIGFFDDSAISKTGEFQFFNALSSEYRDKLVCLIELDNLIGDRNCLYDASGSEASGLICSDILTSSARIGTGFLMFNGIVDAAALSDASASPITMLNIPVVKVESSRWMDSDQRNAGYATYGTSLYQSAASSLFQYSGQISGTEAECYANFLDNVELNDRYDARCTDTYLTFSLFLTGN